MKRGEVTMAVLADFSKAFDTVSYGTVLRKLHRHGFSKSFLRWITNYLTGRKQFVQIDDRTSRQIDVTFGVPQGSILGPVLFNLYVNDLSDNLGPVSSHQYADDTTIYTHGKPDDISTCEKRLQTAIDNLTNWSCKCNLVLNSKKTKVMLFSTPQLSRVHKLDDCCLQLTANGKELERINSTRLLGTEIQQDLSWTKDINSKISSCYNSLSVIKKLKHLAPFHVRKQLAESLVLSKMDYNDVVCHPLPVYLTKRLQRVQLATAGFVLSRYAEMSDILKLGWLPIKERKEFSLTKLTYKALYCDNWPKYLSVEQYQPPRLLRSSNEVKLVIPLERDTLQDSAAKAFNNLPNNIRTCTIYKQYLQKAKDHFMAEATKRHL